MPIFRPLLITLILGAATLLNGSEQENALFKALRNHDITQVKALLDQGVNPNLPIDDKGRTALMIACESTAIYDAYFNYLDIVKLLLAYKADPNITDNQGNTALIHTVYISDTATRPHHPKDHYFRKEACDVVRLLLKHGANPHLKNNAGKAAVDYVTYVYHSPIKHKMENAVFLLRLGPLAYAVQHRPSTSFEAVRYKRAILKLLKKHGVQLTRWQQLTWRV
jgi:ankyrin repeat protein